MKVHSKKPETWSKKPSKTPSESRKKSEILRKILPCLLVFEILGTPIANPRKRGRILHVIVSFYGAFIYLFIFSLTVYNFYNITKGIFKSFQSGFFIHALILYGYLFEALFVIISSMVTSKFNLKLLYKFQYVDELVVNHLNVKVDHKLLRNQLLCKILGTLMIFYSATISAIILIATDHPEQAKLIAFGAFPFSIKRLFAVKYMFHIEFLNFYIDIVRKHLQKHAKYQELEALGRLRLKIPYKHQKLFFVKLKIIHKIYLEFHQISTMINKMFGPSLSVISAMIIVSSVYCGYNFFVGYSNGQQTGRIYGEIVFLVGTAVIITYPGQRTVKKVTILFDVRI